jgi:ubiquinone/menaquinone biosynthesis C-methylase UbiE
MQRTKPESGLVDMGGNPTTEIRPWENWEGNADYLNLMVARAKGRAAEMECAKQMHDILLSRSILPQRVLDVCCSCGHYYHTLRKINPDLEYAGIDISPTYVCKGQEIFIGNPRVNIAVGDVFQLKFADRCFDLVICYNTIQNLPHFIQPLKELTRITNRYVLMRMLCSQERRLLREEIEDEVGKEPRSRYEYHNTWSFKDITEGLSRLGNFNVEFIPDRISSLPDGKGTQVLNGQQFLKGILYEWWHVFITKQEGE